MTGLVTVRSDLCQRNAFHALFSLDIRAQDLWSLGVSNPSLRASGRDFTTSPAILSR